jgi:uncharacterized protein YndB with AHSA1/START domain
MTTDPIRRSITVALGPAEAFRLFTEGMGTWWPFERFSRSGDDGGTFSSLVFETRAGGRIFELDDTGREGSWGTVLDWDPPHRVVLSWKPNDEPRPPTEVEVVFTAREDGSTVVELEHRNWELLGDVAAESRDSYERGWPHVFDERFGGAAGAAA